MNISLIDVGQHYGGRIPGKTQNCPHVVEMFPKIWESGMISE